MFNHVTVLLNEAVEGLNVKPDGIYVDCTLGGAGHSSLILKQLTTGHLYCFDQDIHAIEAARERLEKIGNQFTIIQPNFKKRVSSSIPMMLEGSLIPVKNTINSPKARHPKRMAH